MRSNVRAAHSSSCAKRASCCSRVAAWPRSALLCMVNNAVLALTGLRRLSCGVTRSSTASGDAHAWICAFKSFSQAATRCAGAGDAGCADGGRSARARRSASRSTCRAFLRSPSAGSATCALTNRSTAARVSSAPRPQRRLARQHRADDAKRSCAVACQPTELLQRSAKSSSRYHAPSQAHSRHGGPERLRAPQGCRSSAAAGAPRASGVVATSKRGNAAARRRVCCCRPRPRARVKAVQEAATSDAAGTHRQTRAPSRSFGLSRRGWRSMGCRRAASPPRFPP